MATATPAQQQAIIDQLRNAERLVPGSSPTVGQALRSPQASTLEQIVSDSPGGAGLKEVYQRQNAARLAAVEGVAPTVATGPAMARQDMGSAIGKYAIAGDKAAKAKTSALYNAVPQDEAALYLPDLSPVRDKYFGRGAFVDRGPADKAVETARSIGSLDLPAVSAGKAGQAPLTLAQAVRRAGGISAVENDGLRGEVMGLRGDLKNLVRQNGGKTPGRMAEAMHEAGYIQNEDASTLFNALRDDAFGIPQYSKGANLDRQFSAMRDAAQGGSQSGQSVPTKVTLREFDNLRSSIGIEQRAAAKAGNDKLAASLSDMKSALDARINQVVAGDGAIDEVLPIAWADALDAARKAKLDQVQRFRTGPQAAIFRKGADGGPVVEGGEVARKFWSASPGAADDVKAFRRLVNDNPAMLGQFRSMVTTEGASTQTAAGNLGAKFPRWVEQNLPGLREAFSESDVKALQNIAADIKRAAAADAAGAAKGSPTYRNAANALSNGLLDSPALRNALAHVPLTRGMLAVGLDGLRGKSSASQAKILADLMGNSGQAANALEALGRRAPNAAQANMLASPEFQKFILRAAPAVQANR